MAMEAQGYQVEYEGRMYSSLREFAEELNLNYPKVTAYFQEGENRFGGGCHTKKMPDFSTASENTLGHPERGRNENLWNSTECSILPSMQRRKLWASPLPACIRCGSLNSAAQRQPSSMCWKTRRQPAAATPICGQTMRHRGDQLSKPGGGPGGIPAQANNRVLPDEAGEYPL